MTEETEQNTEELKPNNATNESSAVKGDLSDDDLVNKLVAEKLDTALKPIKEKLDKAFGQRDEAVEKLKALEKEKRDAELARLKEEGKHKEAYERELAEERKARADLEKQNIELTRDTQVRQALNVLDFRNEKAVDMAFAEIAGQLVRNENGVWVHRSGISIKDFVKAFTESEDNSFLFKPKVSSGSGSSGVKEGNSNDSSVKSLFDRPQEEVLKLAREGKLPRRT